MTTESLDHPQAGVSIGAPELWANQSATEKAASLKCVAKVAIVCAALPAALALGNAVMSVGDHIVNHSDRFDSGALDAVEATAAVAGLAGAAYHAARRYEAQISPSVIPDLSAETPAFVMLTAA